jgi:hypothetical protein
VFSSLAGVMRIASIVICLIAVGSFTLFVVNQTDSASTHQKRQLDEEASTSPGATPAGPPPSTHPHESSLRKTLDDASEAVTSPFSAVTAGSSSEWVIRSVNLLLVLVVYGFGLGFLARLVRVRL